MDELTAREKERYKRQMIVNGWGEEGQRKLKQATVGVVGAGGLGSPMLIYLAAAGFGRIIVADGDDVELSNLNRQVLHWDEDVGTPKVDSATAKLRRMNSDIEVLGIHGKIDEDNIEELYGEADALIDALDNFPSRYMLNDFAVKHKLPLFHGAVWGMEGRATTILPGETACFRCVHSEAPSQEVFPVVGITPAIVAAIQVAEAVKYFTGIGELLADKLLIIDAETMEFLRFDLRKDPNCPVCANL
jgi:adenylyltransferase/sulfurtransferase